MELYSIHSNSSQEDKKGRKVKMTSLTIGQGKTLEHQLVSPLYWHYKGACIDTTRRLYGHYKTLVLALQAACSASTSVFVVAIQIVFTNRLTKKRRCTTNIPKQIPFVYKLSSIGPAYINMSGNKEKPRCRPNDKAMQWGFRVRLKANQRLNVCSKTMFFTRAVCL